MYTKLFASMYDGTLATRGPWEAMITFQQLLILADAEGIVDMTVEAIARRTTVPLRIIRKGLECLAAPDPESRSPAEQGRRIVLLSDARSWGWRIVNFVQYRNLRSQSDRREYMKDLMRERRAAERAQSGDGQASIAAAVPPGFERFWVTWPKGPRKQAKGKCLEVWVKRGCEASAEAILEHVAAMVVTDDWQRGYVPAPLVYLNQRRWEGADGGAPSARKVALGT